MNKHNESKTPPSAEDALLDRLFELDTQIDDKSDVDVPEHLVAKLYQITEDDDTTTVHASKHTAWRIPLASVASIALAATLFFFLLPDQSELNAAAARQELAIAFEYLDLSQRKAHPHITNNLREGMQRSTIEPIFDSARAVQL